MVKRLKDLLSLDYHPELIKIMNQSSFLGIFASNILGMSFSLYILYDFIPYQYIYYLAIYGLTIYILRIVTTYKSLSCLELKECKNSRYILMQLILVLLNATLYIFILWLAIFSFVPDIDIFILVFINFALITGTIATLSSVFISFLLYTTLNFSSLILAMLYHGSKEFYIFAFIVFSFSIVFIKAGLRHFRTLKKSILLRESFKRQVVDEVEKNREKDKQILHQARLAQMGEMISMIAHQWRQPLSAINNRINSIDIRIHLNRYDFNNIEDTNEFLEYMSDGHRHIIEYVSTLSETIDEFRTFFKPDKDKEFINITIPIERALSIVETKMSANNIKFIKNYQIDRIVNIHSNEMMQVILNILKNAEDNFDEKNIEDREVEIVTKKSKKYYIIEIRDNGGGISEDILDKIFEPYFSTKSDKNGTGLGLYMSKTMVEEHNEGVLSVKNIDNGVSFEIKLKKEE